MHEIVLSPTVSASLLRLCTWRALHNAATSNQVIGTGGARIRRVCRSCHAINKAGRCRGWHHGSRAVVLNASIVLGADCGLLMAEAAYDEKLNDVLSLVAKL